MQALLAASCLLALAAAPSPTPDLARAKKSIEAFRYADAAKALDAAWAAPGNDRETVLEILKLQGIVAATLGRADAARSAFRLLLYLAPDFELRDADLGPKVTTIFYESRGRLAADTVLAYGPAPTDADTELVRRVGVAVKNDPLKVVKQVRFHLVVEGAPGAPVVTDVALTDGLATVPVDAPGVKWWAALLGDAERVLALAGSEASPLVAEKVTLVPAAPPPPPPEVAVTAPRNYRPAAYVLGGIGAAAAVAGVVFGVRSSSARASLAAAERDADGVVVGLTREQGLALDSKVRTNAIVANSLFGAAAALVGTGATLFLLSDTVAVTPLPGGGVGVAGRLP